MVRAVWFQGNDDRCDSCHGGFDHQHEQRCGGCDRAFCHFCITRVTPGVPGSAFDLLCLSCSEEEAPPDGESRMDSRR